MSKNRKIITILLTFFMCFALSFSAFEIFAKDFNFNVEQSVEEKEKVAKAINGNWLELIQNNEDPDSEQPENDGTNYYIRNPYELAWIAYRNNYNSSFSGFSGKNIYIMNEIDLGDHYWTPIGDSNSTWAFRGTLRGYNNSMAKIRNMKVNASQIKWESGRGYLGFFGYTLNASISNLYIDGSVYSYLDTSRSYSYVGGLVGFATNTTITDVVCNVDVSHYNYRSYVVGSKSTLNLYNCVGGLCGRYSGSSRFIDRVIVMGELTAKIKIDVTLEESSEGILWWKEEFKGTLNNYMGAGGIVGYMITSQSIISFDLASYVEIESNMCYVGGIYGYLEYSGISSTKIMRCVYGGDMATDNTDYDVYAGGIVGYLNSGALYVENAIACMSSSNSGSSSNINKYYAICGNYENRTVEATYCYGFADIDGVIWGESYSENSRLGVTTIRKTNENNYAVQGKLKAIRSYNLFQGNWSFSKDPTSSSGWFIPKDSNYESVLSGFTSVVMKRMEYLPCLNLYFVCCELKTGSVDGHTEEIEIKNDTSTTKFLKIKGNFYDYKRNVAYFYNSSSLHSIQIPINNTKSFKFCVPVTTYSLTVNWASISFFNTEDIDKDKEYSFTSKFSCLGYYTSEKEEEQIATQQVGQTSFTSFTNNNLNTKLINYYTLYFDYKEVNFSLYTQHITADTISNNIVTIEDYANSEGIVDFTKQEVLEQSIQSSNVVKNAYITVGDQSKVVSSGVTTINDAKYNIDKLHLCCDIAYGYELFGIFYKNRNGHYRSITKYDSGATVSDAVYFRDHNGTSLDYCLKQKHMILEGNNSSTFKLLNKLYLGDSIGGEDYIEDGMETLLGSNGTCSIRFYIIAVPKLIKLNTNGSYTNDANSNNTTHTINNDTNINNIYYFRTLKEGYGEDIDGKFNLFEDNEISSLSDLTKGKISSYNNYYFNCYDKGARALSKKEYEVLDPSEPKTTYYNEDFLSNIFMKYKLNVNNGLYDYNGIYTYFGSTLTIPKDGSNIVINEPGYNLWGIKIFYGDIAYEFEVTDDNNAFVINDLFMQNANITAHNDDSIIENDLEIFLVYRVKSYKVINYVFSNSSKKDLYLNSNVGGNAGGAVGSWWKVLKEDAEVNADGNYDDDDYIFGITKESQYFYNQPIYVNNTKDTNCPSADSGVNNLINIICESQKGYSFNQAFFQNLRDNGGGVKDKISDFEYVDINKIKYKNSETETSLLSLGMNNFLPDDTSEEIEFVVAFSVAEYEIKVSVEQKDDNIIFDSNKPHGAVGRENDCGFYISIEQLEKDDYYGYPNKKYDYFEVSKNEEKIKSWNYRYMNVSGATNTENIHGILYGAEITLCIRIEKEYNFLGWYMYEEDESFNRTKEELISTDAYYVFRQGERMHKIYAKFDRNYIFNSTTTLNTDNTVININNKNDFIAFAKQMKNGKSFDKKIISLNTSIDFSGENFEPLGVKGVTSIETKDPETNEDVAPYIRYSLTYTPFKGVFYGNGNTLFNINSTNYFLPIDGVFGVVQGGTINNLNVSNSSFARKQVYYDNYSIDELTYNRYADFNFINNYNYDYKVIDKASKVEGFGSIVGYAEQSKIKGCYVKDVNFSQLVEYKKADNTYEAVETIEKSKIIYSNNVGGLVGYSKGNIISRCYIDSNIVGGANVGGLIGYEDVDLTVTTNISECFITGQIGDSYTTVVRALVGSARGMVNISDVDIEVNIVFNKELAEPDDGSEVTESDKLNSICDNIEDEVTNLQYSINVNDNSKTYDNILETLPNDAWKLYNEKYVLSYFYWYVFA